MPKDPMQAAKEAKEAAKAQALKLEAMRSEALKLDKN